MTAAASVTDAPDSDETGTAPVEHLDVLVVGAGISGIAAAHYLGANCPWASYAIVEARDAIGGTWDLFRYPGIRSDSDMYTLATRSARGTGSRPSPTATPSSAKKIRDTNTSLMKEMR